MASAINGGMADDPWVYFGCWSAADMSKVSSLLVSLGVRTEVHTHDTTEEQLRRWLAWDETSAHPNTGFHLWIHREDLPKVGDKIVVMFPERK
jgi:hypothetical protein